MVRAVLLLALINFAVFGQKQPFDAAALLQLTRVSDPRVSPDGRNVAFTSQTVDVPNNKKPKQVYVVPLNGGLPRVVAEAGERARWFPDGKRLAFVSDRGGSSQIWQVDLDGSNPKQITQLSTEAAGVLISGDGKYIVFTSDVFPECGADDACNRNLLDAAKENKVKARVITSLLYRHWTTWEGARRTHLLSMALENGKVKDLTPGKRDVPPFSLGGPEDYAVSPDGKEVCFAMNADEVPAVSTNSDLFAISIEGGETRKITMNAAADNSPLYSPDGKYIAWRAQSRPGYESDRWRLLLLERATGQTKILTDLLDRSIGTFTWSPDSLNIFFTAEDRGRQSIQFIPVTGGGVRVAVSGDNTLDDMQFAPDGKTIVFTRQSGAGPPEIVKANSTGGLAVQLTHFNDEVLAAHQLTPYEELWVEGAEKAQVQSFLVKPFGFDPGKKYPVLMLIHGGPQGAWGENWTYRWNAQVFAAAGYLVVMPNPRGSVGYGQKFVDDINGDWGGKPYDDIMAVTDKIASLRYVDKDRIAAAGGSYGGFMVDWILGHTTRFKALVSHAGVYDLRSMAAETEELWFPKWEFSGMPWENPEAYDKWSPSHFAKEFSTPTLVVHGELDFRVPYGQGLQLFTALQLRKVPSELLVFPDEGHWVLKPQNSLLWYKTFIDWIDTWTKK